MTKEFTYYSLFAGIGGMTMGLEPLGGKCLGAWEFDPQTKTQLTQEAHKLLHPHIPIHGDVNDIVPEELEDFDVLCFTPPCQSFSIAGKRKGFNDTRGTLTFNALEVARVKQPKVLFMENVKGMLGHDKGNTMSVICHAINEIGYYVDFTILNSKYFDVAQSRERLYLIGVRKDLIEHKELIDIKGNDSVSKAKRRYQQEGVELFSFKWSNSKEIKTRLSDFLDDEVSEDFYFTEEKTNNLISRLENEAIDKEGILFNRKKSAKLTTQCNTLMANTPLKVLGNSNAITVVVERYTHYDNTYYKIRILTPSECLRLQSTPEKYIELLTSNFLDGRCYRFAGNGLTINVVKSIGEELIKYI